MKIALCYSGHMRTFPHLVDSHKKFLIDHNDCDVFLHTWDDWGYYPSQTEQYKRWQPATEGRNFITDEEKQTILDQLQPKSYVFQDVEQVQPHLQDILDQCPNRGPGPPTHNPYNLISMQYKVASCFNLLFDYLGETDLDVDYYDYVVRLRPDIEFYDNVVFPHVTDDSYHSPLINNWGGLNDQLGYSTPRIMNVYAQCIEHIPLYSQQMKHMHPESLIAHHLSVNGIDVISDWDINYDLIRVEELNSRPTEEEAHNIYMKRINSK